MLTRTGLHETLEIKDEKALQKFALFIAAFINRSMHQKETAQMTRVYTRYSEFVAI